MEKTMVVCHHSCNIHTLAAHCVERKIRSTHALEREDHTNDWYYVRLLLVVVGTRKEDEANPTSLSPLRGETGGRREQDLPCSYNRRKTRRETSLSTEERKRTRSLSKQRRRRRRGWMVKAGALTAAACLNFFRQSHQVFSGRGGVDWSIPCD